MGFFARAVVSGFGFSLGKALFDKVKDHIGLGESRSNGQQEGATQVEEIDADGDRDVTRGPATVLESLERAVH
jgi:hypothetical protein